jgi:hypothetical protein
MMTPKRYTTIAAIVFGLIGSSCVVDLGDETLQDPADDGIGEVTQAFQSSCLIGASATAPFTWVQGQARVDTNRNASDTICALHKMQGDFEGGGEIVRTFVDPNTGRWVLEGSSQQSGVAAQAFCARRSCFAGDSGFQIVSPEFAVNTQFPLGCASRSAFTFFGDAATMLTGISGRFNGRGEFARVIQNPNPASNSQLQANACEGSTVIAFAHSLFSGNAATEPAKFFGPEVFVDAWFGPTSVDLAPTSQAFCYLSNVSGKFSGGGEFIRLDVVIGPNGTEVWRLRAQGLNSPVSQRPRGAARCMLYNQH